MCKEFVKDRCVVCGMPELKAISGWSTGKPLIMDDIISIPDTVFEKIKSFNERWGLTIVVTNRMVEKAEKKAKEAIKDV